MAEAASLKLRD